MFNLVRKQGGLTKTNFLPAWLQGELGKLSQLYLLLFVFTISGRCGEGCWGCCNVLCCMVLLTFITLIFCQLSTICIYYLFLLDLLLSANSLTTFVVRELSWVCFPSPALTDWTALSITSGIGPSTSSNQHGNVVSLSSSLVWVVWEVEMWETSLCCFTEEW